MRKGVLVLLIIMAVIVLVVIGIALGISPFMKSYIEKNSKELIGRKVLMNDLSLNIFTGTLRLDSIRLYEKDDATVFASVDSFYMDLELLALLDKRVEVAHLHIIRPFTAVLQDRESFNFDDLIPETDSTEVSVDDPSSFPQSVRIRDIYVGGGRLTYSDLQLNNTIQMNDLGVAIPELAFERGNTNAGIQLKIGDSAKLSSKLVLDMQTNEYLLDLNLEDLPVDIMKPYLADVFSIDKLEGTLSTDLQVKGNTNHLTEFIITGTAKAKDFNLTNGDGELIVTIKDAYAGLKHIDLTSSTYLLDSIAMTGARLDYIIHPDSTDNFTALFAVAVDTLQTDTTVVDSMILKIEKLYVNQSDLVYVDKTLRSTELILPLTQVSFIAYDFDLNGTNKYDIKATVPNGGRIDFSWKANMNDLSNQEINGNFRNINLSLFTPYCLDYTAFEIVKGNMNFTTSNVITNNNIQSKNKIDVFDMRVGKKREDIKPEYNVPLKLALYILKDKDDKIGFDIPVSGNINDPEFSYKKIVLQTLVNLMVKVAVSPVRFLANTLGLNPDKMASMDIEALQTELSARQYSQLNELASLYAKKPDMTVSLQQYIDWNQSMQEYALYQAKADYLSSKSATTSSTAHYTYEDVKNEVKDEDVNFRKYLDERLASSQGTTANQSLRAKLDKLYPKDSIHNGLLDVLRKRDEFVKTYLIGTGGIPEANVKVETMPVDSLLQYKDKSQYKIELALPED